MKRLVLATVSVMLASASPAATTKFSYGWRSEAAGIDAICASLDTGPTTQVCNYPADKVVWFRVTGDGMDSLQRWFLESNVDRYNNLFVTQFSGLGLGRTNGDNWDMRIDFGTVTGGDAGQINAYANILCLNAGAQYAESPAARGVHRPCNKMQLIIDYEKISAEFPGEAFEVIMHALAGGMMHAMGLGWNGAHTDRWTSLAVTPGVMKSDTVTVREVCRVNAWDPTDPSTLFRASPPAC